MVGPFGPFMSLLVLSTEPSKLFNVIAGWFKILSLSHPYIPTLGSTLSCERPGNSVADAGKQTGTATPFQIVRENVPPVQVAFSVQSAANLDDLGIH